MKKDNKEKTVVLFFSLILLSLGIMGLNKLGWLDFFKRPIEKLVNPIREKIHQINFKKQKEVLTTCDSSELDIKIANLEVKLGELEKENQAMKRLLGAPLPPNWQFIPAKVINVSNGIMTINQGSDLGIRKDQIVVFENVLVGQVIQVNPQLSKIKLINHKDTNIKAKILKSEIKGLVKKEKEDLILDEVLQEENIDKDQTIITSGEDEIYPPNLLIAKIDSVEKNEAAIYQKAILKPFLESSFLNNVFILEFN